MCSMTVNPPVYGASKIEGVFGPKHFIEEVNVTVANQMIAKNETFIKDVSLTSFAMHDLEFKTPIGVRTGTVLFVLIAYRVGRRKTRALGYQSV